MYTLTNVERQYEKNKVLSNINCSIPTDAIVVVMGPSGAGKSTLLRLLSFIELPDRGTIRLTMNGDVFDSVKEQKPWPRVTCVFQGKFLWPHMTLLQNIRLPVAAAGHEDVNERVEQVISLFQMSDFIHRFPNEVSGGQAQRVALARALALRPELVLIDEPHTGLDLQQQYILNEHLLVLRESGVGLIIATHSLEFVRRYADRVVIIENGTIPAVSSKEEFMHPDSDYLKRAIGAPLE
ncbi:ATP-binding cassette domain-containing protein [Candidatus Latescibacterota bacterium]